MLIRDILARSNFYTALPGFYHDRHIFGVCGMLGEEDDETIVRFYNRAIGTYAIAVDARGRCNTMWYGFEFTAAQIEEHFGPLVGEKQLPQSVISALSQNRKGEKFWIDSLIEPNPGFVKGSDVESERAFRQIYWIEGAPESNHGCLLVQGRHKAPMLASRWATNGFDTYGPGPAHESLGDIKQLQYLEGKKLKLIDLNVDPPIGVPEHMRNKGAALRPGERIYVTPQQNGQKVEPIYVPLPNSILQVREEIKEVMDRVGEAFYASLFRMLDFLDDRQRTAYEISERKEEKVAMLGPALETLSDEVLDPVIELVYFYADRRGLIPDPPPALKNVQIKVEYTSMLAQAAKAAGTGTIERVLGIVTTIAQGKQDPTVWDKIDVDYTIEAVNDQQGGPARMVRNENDVNDIREGRAQAQQMQQAAQMAPAMKQGADALKTLGEAKSNDGSMLQALGQGMQQ